MKFVLLGSATALPIIAIAALSAGATKLAMGYMAVTSIEIFIVSILEIAELKRRIQGKSGVADHESRGTEP